MPLPKKQLFIKRSGIPGAGKGLFTRHYIAKGTLITEYKGKVTTWKQVLQTEIFNGYVYYISRNHVIDARPYKKALARYVNDAKGLNKIKGLLNNARYIKEGNKVFIESVKDIDAGAEILVDYGKEYWDVMRYNNKTALKENARAKR